MFNQLFGVEKIIKKKRAIFLYENVRIHLDQVESLGHFFKLEAVYETDSAENLKIQEQKIEYLMYKFEIEPEDLLRGSYREMSHLL